MPTKSPLPAEAERLLEQFTTLDDFQHAADALAILGRFWLSNPDLSGPVARDYCEGILQAHSELHQTLCACHTSLNYGTLWDSDTFLSLSQFRLPQHQKIVDELKVIEPRLKQFANGETGKLTSWRTDEIKMAKEYSEKLSRQNVPQIPTKRPALLLHDLGGFSNDPCLRKRLHSIFRSGERNHVFLVNNSGSGKTRLLYEGLCLNWGIYFTFAVDSTRLGSTELQFSNEMLEVRKISSIPTERNVKLAERAYAENLLINLLVFQRFAQLMDQETDLQVYKKRWLLYKLLAPSSGVDRFCSSKLDTDDVSDDFIRGHVAQALSNIRRLCKMDPNEPLYLAVDECNVGSRVFLGRFSDEGGGYPALKVLLRSWLKLTEGFNVTIVCAGTKIPREYFRYDPAEWSDWTWCSNTGWFDNQAEHTEYISKFTPPSLSRTSAGEAYFHRMFKWLKGRHRATVAPLQITLQTGFHSPHLHLDDFVANYTRYQPRDGTIFTTSEPKLGTLTAETSTLQPQSFDAIQRDPLIVFTIHEILLYYLVTGQHPLPFELDRVELISLDVGRFKDNDAKVVVMDEPLSVVANAVWFTKDPMSLWDFKYLRATEAPVPQRRHCTAPFMALYLLHAFASGRSLSDLFNFAEDAPPFARQSGEVVLLHQEEGKDITVSTLDASKAWRSAVPFAMTAKSARDTEDWLNHHQKTPFCIPWSNTVDLVFVVRLSDGTLLWIVVHSSIVWVDSDLSSGETLRIMQELNHSSLFKDEEVKLPALSGPCPGAGPHSLLRVIATFPVSTPISASVEESIVSPVASLNADVMNSILDGVSLSDALEMIVTSVIGDREELSGGKAPSGSKARSRSRNPPQRKRLSSTTLLPRKRKKLGAEAVATSSTHKPQAVRRGTSDDVPTPAKVTQRKPRKAKTLPSDTPADGSEHSEAVGLRRSNRLKKGA